MKYAELVIDVKFFFAPYINYLYIRSVIETVGDKKNVFAEAIKAGYARYSIRAFISD